MIPWRDDVPSQAVPFVDHALTALNVAGFAAGLLLVELFQRPQRRLAARDRWWEERR